MKFKKSKKLKDLESKIIDQNVREQSESDDDDTRARGEKDDDWSEDNDDADVAFAQERSKIRQKTAGKLSDFDPKYRGKKASRKTVGLLDDDERDHEKAELGFMFEMPDNAVSSEEEEELDGEEQSDEEDPNEDDDMGSEDSDADLGDMNLDDYMANGDDDDNEMSDDEETENNNDLKKFSRNNVQAEVNKGLAIKKQLKIWDTLLECRIQSQKILKKVNQFPQPDVWPEFKQKGSEDYNAAIKKCQTVMASFLDNSLELQAEMLPDLREASGAKRKSDEDDEPEFSLKKKMKLSEYSNVLAEMHEAITPIRNNIIEKWNEKTKLASGQIKSKSFSSMETSTLRQIEHILSDQDRLIRRTQLKRTAYKVLGQDEKDDEEEHDEEIFDDDDFYHMMLRELIERKTAGVHDPVQLGQQWLKLQKMRSKLKRKVDTKASKGRKLRYDIHSKLVNFMAPMFTKSMSDEAKNELFSSLFGNASGPSQ